MIGGIRSKVEGSIREIVFGAEDSLVSTLGAITGIAAGTNNEFVVVLSGVVLIVVEALSMSAGSYLSSKSAREVYNLRHRQDTSRLLQERVTDDESFHEALRRKKFSDEEIGRIMRALGRERELWLKEVQRHEYRSLPGVSSSPLRAAVVMGLFYLAGGFFPLVPYLVLPITYALAPSILLTTTMLFLLGFFKARIVNGHWLKGGFEMAAVSLSAAILGFAIGRGVAAIFGLYVI